MKSPANAVLTRQVGEVAGEADQGLAGKLACLADAKPGNDAERCAREVLTWLMTGVELAKAARAQSPTLHGSGDAAEPEAEAPHVQRREQPHPARRRHGPVVSVQLDLCIR
ncbi:MAG: hypothetical protein KBG48_19605 [Kofleriaceae bacterium]|jgi:hypothetical protein|nr:hypothetical protein [Kofleriaceae bacterium]MBP9169617.1 hypothetical protein [Kofleriaceae bacterium]MBP9859491.1 hypothetical protein [Kofleriaceae bacterium]